MVEDIINPDKREVESREKKKSETRSRDEMFADWVDLKCDMLDVVLASMGRQAKHVIWIQWRYSIVFWRTMLKKR